MNTQPLTNPSGRRRRLDKRSELTDKRRDLLVYASRKLYASRKHLNVEHSSNVKITLICPPQDLDGSLLAIVREGLNLAPAVHATNPTPAAQPPQPQNFRPKIPPTVSVEIPPFTLVSPPFTDPCNPKGVPGGSRGQTASISVTVRRSGRFRGGRRGLLGGERGLRGWI